jgi:Arc/MetJ-type ribon-helix-helix transcriptional regulator
MSENQTNRLLIELNLSLAAKIDVLVEKEYYKDRAAFLEKAVEAQLNLHDETFQELEHEGSFAIGIIHYSAKDLEKVAAEGKMLNIRIIGGVSFSKDVTPELLERTVSQINLTGYLRAPDNLLPILNERRYSILGRKYDPPKKLDSGDQE